MGAIEFKLEMYAETEKEGYRALVQEAKEEYGEDSYNGTISTCDLGGCRTIQKKYTPEADLKAEIIIEKERGGEKWVAKVLDLGVAYYEKVSVRKKAVVKDNQPAAKFAMKYAVLCNGKIQSYYDKKNGGG